MAILVTDLPNSCFFFFFPQLNTVSYIHIFPWNSVETQAREQLNNFVASVKQNQSATEHNKRLTVSFSHVPLNELQDYNLKTKILNSLHPNYIFSGHIHYTMYTTHTYAEGRVAKEFTLPTCSYRMGQERMGIGAVVIGKSIFISSSTSYHMYILFFSSTF